VAALRSVLVDSAEWRRLAREAASRPLPTWSDTAKTLVSGLK
jgi:hypothetical protein